MFKTLALFFAIFASLYSSSFSSPEQKVLHVKPKKTQSYRGRALQYQTNQQSTQKKAATKKYSKHSNSKNTSILVRKRNQISSDNNPNQTNTDNTGETTTPPLIQEEMIYEYSPLEKSYDTLFASEALEGLKNLETEVLQTGYTMFDFERTELPSASSSRQTASNITLLQGDELYIAISTSEDVELYVALDQKSQIFLPKIGIINLFGLSYQDAEKAIRKRVQSYYKEAKVYIRLNSNVERSIYVIGKVKNPGVVIISQQASLLNALIQSGGITRNGSLRNIEIRKGNQTTKVDLYDLLMTGKWKPLSLSGGETVFVPGIKKTVAIFGEVLEPGIYELKDNNSLSDVINYAQGFTPAAHQLTVNIFRSSPNNNNVDVHSAIKDNFNKSVLKNSDVIHVLPRRHLQGNSINITGAVNYPGTYQVNKGDTLASALKKAGGVLYGHIVTIKRRLPELKMIGLPQNRKANILYQTMEYKMTDIDINTIKVFAGDTIEVPLENPITTEPEVIVNGAVKEPGPYPYFQNLNLYHLLNLAKGVTPEANIDGISVGRYTNNELKRIFIPKALKTDAALQSIILKPGDVVTVPTLSKNTILAEASGEFNNPGVYLLPKGARLSDLIIAAGGMKKTAYIPGAAFFRKSVSLKYEEQLRKMANRLEQDLLRSQTASVQSSLASQQEKNALIFARQERLIANLQSAESPGRVIIKVLGNLEKLKETSDNIILEDEDRLFIPTEPSTVHIIGQVNNPNTIVYSSNLFLKDYIDAGGGLTRHADKAHIFIIRSNGAVIPAQKITSLKKGWLSGRSQSHAKHRILPGDTIIIPEDFEIKPNKLQYTKDITQIMFQIITSIGVAVAAF